MKKIFSIFLVLVLTLSVFSISASAAVSPTAEVIESSINSNYFSENTYGSIKTKVYENENKIVLKVTAKEGYTFSEWEIPDTFELDENSSITDECITLFYEGNITEADIEEITASFENIDGELCYLSVISKESVSNSSSSVSPTTSDIPYFNIENGIMLLICCIASVLVTLIVYKKKEKR